MSLSKSLCGRKVESSIHGYFTFISDKGVKGKSKCKDCGIELCGKNPTNLIGHLNRCHKKLFAEFSLINNEQKQAKQKADAAKEGMRLKEQRATITLPNLTERISKSVPWPTDSVEYRRRLDSLLEMIISTSSPINLIDETSFRSMFSTLDPKFVLPGIISFS